MAKRYLRYTVAALLIACPGLTIADATDTISTLVLDVKYWSYFNWTEATKSEVWQNQDFHIFVVTPESNGEKILKSRKININERSYNALLIESIAPIEYPNSFSISITSALQRADCPSILAEWEKSFGSATTKVDNSYQAYAGFNFGETQTNWKLKNTTAIATCTTVGTESNNITDFTIRFQSAALALPEPPIHLQCTRSYSMVGSPKEDRTSLPLIFSVIPARAVIVDGAGILVTKLTSLSDTTIEFRTKVSDLLSYFIIDRTSGSLAGNGKSVSLDRIILHYSGQCDTRIPGKRRF